MIEEEKKVAANTVVSGDQNDDEFSIKQVSQGEFIIQTKVPKHAAKHVFFEDDVVGDGSQKGDE